MTSKDARRSLEAFALMREELRRERRIKSELLEALLDAPLPSDFSTPQQFEIAYILWFQGQRYTAIAKATRR